MNSRRRSIFIQVACTERDADNWITALYESFSDILIFNCDVKFCRFRNRVTVIDRVHEPATRPQLTDLAPMACNRCQSPLPVLRPGNRGHRKVTAVPLVRRFTPFNSSDHKRDHAAIDREDRLKKYCQQNRASRWSAKGVRGHADDQQRSP